MTAVFVDKLENLLRDISGWPDLPGVEHGAYRVKNCAGVICGDKRSPLRLAMMAIAMTVAQSTSPYLIMMPGGPLFGLGIKNRLLRWVVRGMYLYLLAMALRYYHAREVVLVSHGDCAALQYFATPHAQRTFHEGGLRNTAVYLRQRGYLLRAFYLDATVSSDHEVESMRWHEVEL